MMAAFRFAELYLWPDNDDPGVEHIRRLHERLEALDIGITRQLVVRDDSLPAGGDAADYFQARMRS